MYNDKSEEIKFTVKDHDTFGKDAIMGWVTVKSSDLWKRAFRVDCEGFSEFTEELQLRDQWDYDSLLKVDSLHVPRAGVGGIDASSI